MGETHLYSIGSAGEATETPPPAPPGGSDTEKPGRAQAKARPTEVVPTDRMKFELQVKALRTVCTASKNGSEWVNAEKMGSLMGISPATAPLNNAFFLYLGLLEKQGKGDYRPTELALKFQQKWTFDQKAAPALLAPAFTGSWFLDAVEQKLALGETSIAEMVETLAGVAHTDDSYARQYHLCLEWLAYAGIITLENGMVALTGGSAAPVVEDTTTEDLGAGGDEHTGEPEVDIPEVPKRTPKDTTRPPAIISLTIDVTVTADDLQGLTPEQINALFDGVGKVASVKAALT